MVRSKERNMQMQSMKLYKRWARSDGMMWETQLGKRMDRLLKSESTLNAKQDELENGEFQSKERR
jgi:hypothetical protein